MTPEEFIKQEQEIIIEYFEKYHEVEPQFIILRSTGKIERYLFVNGIQDDRQKALFYASMKKICKQKNVIACVQVMESWTSKSESGVRPTLDPDRQSSIIILLYTKTEEKMSLYFENNGKLELVEDNMIFDSQFGNPFNLINIKNKNYN
jgi:hypothetical protein